MSKRIYESDRFTLVNYVGPNKSLMTSLSVGTAPAEVIQMTEEQMYDALGELREAMRRNWRGEKKPASDVPVRHLTAAEIRETFRMGGYSSESVNEMVYERPASPLSEDRVREIIWEEMARKAVRPYIDSLVPKPDPSC